MGVAASPRKTRLEIQHQISGVVIVMTRQDDLPTFGDPNEVCPKLLAQYEGLLRDMEHAEWEESRREDERLQGFSSPGGM